MNARKAIDGKALIYMIGLCAIWGMQQTAVKLAAPAMPEILQVALRSGVALVVIAGIAAVRRETGWFFKGTWKAGSVIGLLFGLEYFLVTQGLRFTTASHISIFLYTSPIFAALGLHMRLPEERLDAAQWVGIAVAFLGIVVSGKNPPRGLENGAVIWTIRRRLRCCSVRTRFARRWHRSSNRATDRRSDRYPRG